MKKISLIFICLIVTNVLFAQTTWNTSGVNIYNTNTGSVGIGTTTPLTLLEVRKDQTAPTITAVRNLSTGAGASARFDLVTNTTNSYQVSALHNNNGLPYYQFSVGSGVKSTYFDAPEFNWRNTSSSITFMKITSSGNVGIGTVNPGTFKLAVEGKIGAREVRVTATNPWPDYVFQPNYGLLRLDDLERFVKENNHLPGIPSAKDIEGAGGVDLGEMNRKLLEKIEELTLYIIEIKKDSDKLKEQLKKLEQTGN